MATTKRANVISANVLAKAIDSAVSLASKRLDAKLENRTLAFNWEIIGRQISGLKGTVKLTKTPRSRPQDMGFD